jgi:hypothetical protein
MAATWRNDSRKYSVKTLSSTEEHDLLVLGSGASGNPSKSTGTLRSTSASPQAMEKTYLRYAKTVMPGFNSSKEIWKSMVKSSRLVTGRPPMKKRSIILPLERARIFCCSIRTKSTSTPTPTQEII